MNLSRRDFSKLGAMGLAARILPEGFGQTNSQTDGRKIGYCVIGIGRIADHFLRGVQQSSYSKITGFVSGHRDKAERFAAQYGVPKDSIYNYENMDRMIDNKQINAVYVALPNNMHAEYTIRSAKAGKHVLCEKPMSTTVADAEAMIAACKTANVKLMIAYRLHYEPFNLKAIQMIRNGEIGEVQTINGAFGFNIAPHEWRTTKKYAGGGSLFDVGIYVVNACRYLTGEEPASFTAITSTLDHDGRFNEVEENISWTMKFPSGILATGSSTYGAQMPGYFKVFGTKGWLGMNPAYNYDGLRLQANYWKTPRTPPIIIDEANPERDPKQFTREADHMSECILNNRTPTSPGEEGLRDMRYIKAIYYAAGIDLA